MKLIEIQDRATHPNLDVARLGVSCGGMGEPIDTLMHAQDKLLERLLNGRISSRNLHHAFRRHVIKLTAAGFKPGEAESCFWDAVHTADHTREQLRAEAQKGGAA